MSNRSATSPVSDTRHQVKVTRSMVASARAQVSIARELGKAVAPAIATIAQIEG